DRLPRGGSVDGLVTAELDDGILGVLVVEVEVHLLEDDGDHVLALAHEVLDPRVLVPGGRDLELELHALGEEQLAAVGEVERRRRPAARLGVDRVRMTLLGVADDGRGDGLTLGVAHLDGDGDALFVGGERGRGDGCGEQEGEDAHQRDSNQALRARPPAPEVDEKAAARSAARAWAPASARQRAAARVARSPTRRAATSGSFTRAQAVARASATPSAGAPPATRASSRWAASSTSPRATCTSARVACTRQAWPSGGKSISSSRDCATSAWPDV